MKKILLLLSIVFALNSMTAAFASSTNTVTKVQHVKNGTSLASASYEIVPHSEVETGSSIIITFTNATVFSQDIIDGTSTDTKAIGYLSGGYQYNENGITWDGSASFSDVMPYTGTSRLPYYIRRMNDEQIEVFLINLPDVYVDSSLASVNGSGRHPYYSIPLVVYADTDEDSAEVTVEIDSNGTSISSSNSSSINNSLAETSTTTTEAETETTTVEADDESSSSAVLSNNVQVQIGAYTIAVNGTSISIDAPAYIQEQSSSTMIPLRAVSQGIIGDEDCVEWDAETKTAVISYAGNEVSFSAGSNIMYVNGEAVEMSNGVSAEITNSRMFVPFRALGEALGAEVSWDAETKTAYFN